jgi:putative DNA primase/helicase
MTDRFAVSIFPDLSGSNMRSERFNLAELGEKVLTTKADDKYSLPLIKLASFGDRRTENNSLRHNANITSISGIEGDYDAKEVSFEEAVRLMREARLNALLYTSPSYTVAEPKWRVILPTSRELLPPERAKLAARVNGVLGGILAGESFTLSQGFFCGSVNGSQAPLIEIILDGDFIDLRDDLDAGAVGRSQSNPGVVRPAAHPRPSNASDKQADPELVYVALVVAPNEVKDWVAWNNMGMAAFNATNGHPRGFEGWDLWSKKIGAEYNNNDNTSDRWHRYFTSPPTEIGAGSIFQKADQAQPGWRGLFGLSLDAINEVLRLSQLSRTQYEVVRKAKAKQLHLRAPVLDQIIANLQPQLGDGDDMQGTKIEFEQIVPWPDAVEGEALMTDMIAAIRKYVVLSEHQAMAVSLWAIHTHAVEAAEHTPRLQIKSPTLRCGKSTLLRTISLLVFRPVNTENITTAALFRVIGKHKPTLLIDEADSFLKRDNGKDNEDMRGILNAGHARGGQVIRTVGEDFEPRAFEVFGPVAYAWLVKRNMHVAQTLEDRSITIELRRRLPSEEISHLRVKKAEDLRLLRRRASRWVEDHATELAASDPVMPEELNDRAMDNWRPLIAIADAMSANLGRLAREAAVKIAKESIGTGEEDMSLTALADVAAIFEARDENQLASQVIISDLIALADRPWNEWGRGRQQLTQNALARLLKAYGIKPKKLRFGTETLRGYLRDPIMEAKGRFVDAVEEEEDEDTTERNRPLVP